MIIIVEGPDGAGKTTVAKALAERYGFAYQHFSYPKNKAERDATFSSYMKIFADANCNYVVDRMFPSAMIYSKVMNREPDLTEAQHDALVSTFLSTVSCMVYCTGGPKKLWKRCTKRGEDYITSYETFEKICEEYDLYMNALKQISPSRIRFMEV